MLLFCFFEVFLSFKHCIYHIKENKMLFVYVVPSRELGGVQCSLQLTEVYLSLAEKSVPGMLRDSPQTGM